MTGPCPEWYDQHAKFIPSDTNPRKHLCVRVSTTPPEILVQIREWDRNLFEYDGEHAIEFLED